MHPRTSHGRADTGNRFPILGESASRSATLTYHFVPPSPDAASESERLGTGVDLAVMAAAPSSPAVPDRRDSWRWRRFVLRYSHLRPVSNARRPCVLADGVAAAERLPARRKLH